MRSNQVWITPALRSGIVAITTAGHGVAIEPADGGNNHTSTYLIIGVRHPDEAGYIRKLRIRYTHSYQRYNSYTAVSTELGELCFGEVSIAEILARVTHNLGAWKAEHDADIGAAARQMALV